MPKYVAIAQDKRTKVRVKELRILRKDAMRSLIERNVEEVQKTFAENPEEIFVSVQLEDDQIAHLESGLMGRARRLIPLTLLAKLIQDLNK